MDTRDSAIAQRWAICRFTFKGPFVVLDYHDNGSRSNSALRIYFEYSQPWPVLDVEEVGRALQTLVGLPRVRSGVHGSGLYPVAVYHSFLPGPDLSRLKVWFFDWLRTRPWAAQLQQVELSKSRRVSRNLFTLPLRILVEPAASGLVREFQDQWWTKQSDVPLHGLRIESLADRDLELSLRLTDCSILFVNSIRAVAPEVLRLPVSKRPRLLIGGDDDHPAIAGTAALCLGAVATSSFVTDFLMGVVHDWPLHECLKWALRSVPSDMNVATLVATPETNQSLRLREALISLRRDATKLGMSAGTTQVGTALGPATSQLIQKIQSHVATIETLDPSVQFQQENTGLAPLAGHSKQVHELWQAIRKAEPSQGEQGPRVVDVALLRLETEPWYRPVAPTGSLVIGAAYDLRVHIGPKLPESLVTGPVTPIDPLLGPPDIEGHHLQVSVQGKDFDVIGPSVQPMLLPRTGWADPVYFRIRAPAAPGIAELRIYVHHRNHLVQSLLLRASIAPTEVGAGNIAAKEEFSRSEGFADLDALGSRTISIGVNEGQSGTHQINVVSDGAQDAVALGATAFKDAVSALRQELRSRILVNGLARTFAPVAAGQPPSTEAAQAIIELARKGRAVYDALFGSVNRSVRASLVRLQGAANEKIQVVRFCTRSAFPWPLLYDWALPREVTGAPTPQVCLGTAVDANGGNQPCRHGSDTRVICVRGFWGIRHQVEELLKEMRTARAMIPRPSNDPVWVVSSSSMPEAVTLASELKADLSSGVTVGPWTEAQLLDLLWRAPAARPAVLILLGHLQEAPVAQEPTGARVELEPLSQWFTLSELSLRVSRAATPWDDPRTVLVLATCDSAATKDDTLNDFVTAFHGAGAGAIVGTQLEVGLSQAVQFAKLFTESLWTKSLGETMREVRSHIVQRGDPGGFLFQSFGDVDLRLQ